MKNFKKKSIGLLTSAAVLVSAFGGFAPVMTYAAPDNTILLEENYTVLKSDQAALESMGWTENGEFKGGSGFEDEQYGSFTAGNGTLVMSKSDSSSAGADSGKTVYAVEKTFEYEQTGYDGNDRVALRQNNFKGKYAIDFNNAAFTQTTGSSWIDMVGYRGSANGQFDSVGRLTVVGGTGELSVYNNKLNVTNNTNVPMWKNATTKDNIRIVFDSATSTFQIYKGDMSTPVSTTATVGNGKKGDTFRMTSWGDPTKENDGTPLGAYVRGLRFSVNKNVSTGSFVELDGLSLTELERMPDTAVDTMVADITMDDLTNDPAAVTEPLKALPGDAVDGSAEVTWSSDKPDVISNDGQTVVRQAETTDVTMTAKIVNTADQFTVFKDFKLTVPAVEDPNTPELVLARAKAALTIDQLTAENPNHITQNLSLKTSWIDAGQSGQTVNISWNSNNPTVINHAGVLQNNKPDADQTVIMTATFSLPGEAVTATETYTFTVKKWEGSRLLFSETFDNKQVVNNQVEGWEYTQSGSSTAANTIQNNKLVMTKTSAAGSGGAESMINQFKFNYISQPYDDATRTQSYQRAFNGKYKLELNIKPHVTKEFAVVSFLGGSADGTTKKPFSLCIHQDVVDIYVSSGKYFSVSSTSINNKDTKITFTVDTKSDDVQISINDGTPVTYTVEGMTKDAYFLQGAYFAMKESQAKDDSITINSVSLYEVSSYDADSTVVESAMNKVLINSLSDAPAAVTENLKTLPATIDGVNVTWSSNNEDYITSKGKLLQRPIDNDVDVTMTAIFEKDGTVRYKDYKLTVKKEDNPQVILKMAADALDYSDLVSGDPQNLNENIKTSANGLYGTTITWESSAPEYVGHDGVIDHHDDKVKKEFTMTATFHLNGQTYQKQYHFRLTVNFAGNLYDFYTTDFTGDTIASNITAIDGAGKVVQQDGKIYLQHPQAGSGTSINIYPALGDKKFVMDQEMMIEVDVLEPTSAEKCEIIFYGSNGNRIATVYTGTENKKKGYTVVGKKKGSSDVVYSRHDVGTEDMPLHVKAQVNFQSRAMTIWVNDAADTKIDTIREDANDLAYIAINNVDNTNNSTTNTGTLQVNSAKVTINKAEIPELILNHVDYLGPVEELNGIVTKDLTLLNTVYGETSVAWTSSNPDILGHDGKLNRDAITEDVDLTLTFRLEMTDDPEIGITKTFPLTVRYIDPENIAFNKETFTTTIPNTGHSGSKAVDSALETSWETMRSDDEPWLGIDLGQASFINQVDLWEADILGRYPVQSFVIEASSDKKNWKQLAVGGTLGADQQTLSLPLTYTRYVRYRVTEKDAGNSGLREFQVSLRGAAVKPQADLQLLKEEYTPKLRNVTADVTLPTNGSLYNSVLTYSSSIPNYFSNEGKVTRPSQTVSGTLTVTATLDGETATVGIPVSVKGTSNNNSGGTSGGGGGGSNTPNSGMTPYPPATATPDPSNSFADVLDSHWAYSYVEVLKKQGIVSGDGDNTFRPEDNISREEFLKMLLGALKIKTVADTDVSFADVAQSDWSYPYIATGVKIGIVKGISETEFGAGQNVTREDMSVLCDRALTYMEKTLDETADVVEFADAGQISDYAVQSVVQMQKFGVINGYEDGTFCPQNNASRAEAAKIIYMIEK